MEHLGLELLRARQLTAREPLIAVRVAHSDERVRRLAEELIAAVATAMGSLRLMVETVFRGSGPGDFDTARDDHYAAMTVAERLHDALVRSP